MLDRIFPRTIDNSFSGWRAAIWLFALALLIRLTISLNTIFNTRDVAVGADGIPLNTIGAEGAERFLRLFAILGLAQLMPVLIGTLALVRYRAMIPLLYLLILIYVCAFFCRA